MEESPFAEGAEGAYAPDVEVHDNEKGGEVYVVAGSEYRELLKIAREHVRLLQHLFQVKRTAGNPDWRATYWDCRQGMSHEDLRAVSCLAFADGLSLVQVMEDGAREEVADIAIEVHASSVMVMFDGAELTSFQASNIVEMYHDPVRRTLVVELPTELYEVVCYDQCTLRALYYGLLMRHEDNRAAADPVSYVVGALDAATPRPMHVQVEAPAYDAVEPILSENNVDMVLAASPVKSAHAGGYSHVEEQPQYPPTSTIQHEAQHSPPASRVSQLHSHVHPPQSRVSAPLASQPAHTSAPHPSPSFLPASAQAADTADAHLASAGGGGATSIASVAKPQRSVAAAQGPTHPSVPMSQTQVASNMHHDIPYADDVPPGTLASAHPSHLTSHAPKSQPPIPSAQPPSRASIRSRALSIQQEQAASGTAPYSQVRSTALASAPGGTVVNRSTVGGPPSTAQPRHSSVRGATLHSRMSQEGPITPQGSMARTPSIHVQQPSAGQGSTTQHASVVRAPQSRGGMSFRSHASGAFVSRNAQASPPQHVLNHPSMQSSGPEAPRSMVSLRQQTQPGSFARQTSLRSQVSPPGGPAVSVSTAVRGAGLPPRAQSHISAAGKPTSPPSRGGSAQVGDANTDAIATADGSDDKVLTPHNSPLGGRKASAFSNF